MQFVCGNATNSNPNLMLINMSLILRELFFSIMRSAMNLARLCAYAHMRTVLPEPSLITNTQRMMKTKDQANR